jgi:transcriptional regulator with XRE-family HTH domain
MPEIKHKVTEAERLDRIRIAAAAKRAAVRVRLSPARQYLAARLEAIGGPVEVGRALGVDYHTASRWMHGTRTPSLAMCMAIGTRLGFDGARLHTALADESASAAARKDAAAQAEAYRASVAAVATQGGRL